MNTQFILPGAGSNRQIEIDGGRSKFGWLVIAHGGRFAWHPSKRSATRAAMSAAKDGPWPWAASIRVRKAASLPIASIDA